MVKNEQKNHYHILSLDLSTDEEDQCPTWKTLGFELFKIIVLTVMVLGAIYGAGNLLFISKDLISKWKENKRKAEERRIEKLKINLNQEKRVGK